MKLEAASLNGNLICSQATYIYLVLCMATYTCVNLYSNLQLLSKIVMMDAIVCKQREKAVFTCKTCYCKLYLTAKVPAFEFISVNTKSSASLCAQDDLC